MDFINTLMQLDWTRAARFWLLVAIIIAVWEAAFWIKRGFSARSTKGEQ
jgi:hypothetical protein